MQLNSHQAAGKEIIDLLYKQFYSGSLQPTTEREEGIVKEFLTSNNYVMAGGHWIKIMEFVKHILRVQLQ